MTLKILGHRGSSDPAHSVRENTLASFARSRALGAAGVELDVHLTSDGSMAVHHDPLVGELGAISNLTASQLPADIPELGEVLRTCAGMFVNIEIKNLPGQPGFDADERLAGLVADLISSVGRQGDTIVSSFWPATLEAVRASDNTVATGLLMASWFDPADAVEAATSRSLSAIHPVMSLVSAPLVVEAHRAGLGVATWTVNEPADVLAMAALGVDTIISDDVAMAVTTLAGRVTEP